MVALPGLPRFVPEDVMAQLESDQALGRLPDATTRHLVVVVIETGLRAGDACRLGFDCLLADSVGWPCLRFTNAKVCAEQLVPLTARAADAIRAQQAEVTRRWPASPWLFPAPTANPDGARPFTYNTLRQRLGRWQAAIDPRDAGGRPVRVSAHRLSPPRTTPTPRPPRRRAGHRRVAPPTTRSPLHPPRRTPGREPPPP